MFSLGPQPAFAAGGSFGGTALFLCKKASHPRSSISNRAFKKKTPDSVKRMRLINSPSTDMSDLVMAIHTIPARGTRASKIESRSITGSQNLLKLG
jgi:hypothetical protein